MQPQIGQIWTKRYTLSISGLHGFIVQNGCGIWPAAGRSWTKLDKKEGDKREYALGRRSIWAQNAIESMIQAPNWTKLDKMLYSINQGIAWIYNPKWMREMTHGGAILDKIGQRRGR